jgi:hypothetical protein
MSATELGGTGIPADPQSESLEWSVGVGETRSIEWRGNKSATRSKYNELKGGIGVQSVSYQNAEGRSRVVAKIARTENGSNVTIIEELLGVDLVRPIYAAETFRTLTDDQVSGVLAATEARLLEADITGFASWTATQKELRWQILHGQESYYETLFVLRVKKQGIRSTELRGIFEGVNKIQALPTLSPGMRDLVGTLPAGEWLYRPPQISYVHRGIWSVESEWNWAPKWSVVYDGSMKGYL